MTDLAETIAQYNHECAYREHLMSRFKTASTAFLQLFRGQEECTYIAGHITTPSDKRVLCVAFRPSNHPLVFFSPTEACRVKGIILDDDAIGEAVDAYHTVRLCHKSQSSMR